MKSVLVCGPQGCGKTRNATLIAGALDLTKIVDNWQIGDELPLENTLILTNAAPNSRPWPGEKWLTFMTYNEAMQHVYRPPLCIYHASCADGFGAAWVVRKAMPHAEFHPARYGEPMPDVAGRVVVLVDFSYSRDQLLQMAEIAKRVLVIDHHKTAAEALAGLPQVADASSWAHSGRAISTCFDMERSGAGLTWDFFFPGQPRPDLINHIEDRDLWRFKLEGTREVQANVFSYPYDFEVWDQLAATPAEQLRSDGIAIERKHHKDIAELLKALRRRMTIGGYDVPAANLPYIHSSDAGHVMAQGEPFAACYWDTPAGRTFSLRSETDGLDVSAIAKLYGGGGHRNAAGFTVSYEHPLAHNAPPLKCFQVGDYDLVAAHTPEQAIKLLCAFCGYDSDTFNLLDVTEWTDAQLDSECFEEEGITPADPWRVQFAACVYPQYLGGWE
ncbi:DHH family phosphoesterase [Pseudomonas panipatensis]|uniref:Oligoribonuclease NrnB or cAMP/cGMP phosphodiesterase, DHH superfamily n=1 Tax=Pseudomonas panipatensis TaxID=428992 RepID=A0A1G8CTH4_9PSED|nr:phosphohydrolase [Pseudomonas panipatensis]SDH48775.1 Oligoribonuclease NrnB or cAMP/cGMP phosphodiesterase, DHH superfamily [Pseudomonas panipatensis]SMP63572.1 Oligoribonuclease NrnB or cAMP/cGMP phosphodiesterase, DHH superfamily [Pseudomonas panipatensis]